MACSCQSKKKGVAQIWVVTAPDGEKKSYASEVEAAGAAARVGGTYRKQS